jgi:hypothetical protein
MGRYAYAKSALPTDWADKVADDLKIEIKNYALESVLKHRKESVIFAHVEKLIEEFLDEFDDDEIDIGRMHAEELREFARTAYDRVKDAVGTMPTPLFVAALASPETVSVQRKEEIGRYAMVDFTVGNKAASRIAREAMREQIKDPNAIQYSRATSADDYYRIVHKQVKKFIDEEFPALKQARNYSDKVSSRNIAEMTIRYRKYLDDRAALEAKGVKLVFVPPHCNCSKRCQKWQGRVYSLDGTSGSINGRQYVPIENAVDKVTYTSPNTGKVYPAGLFSYNCRHLIKEYKDGQNIEFIPASKISKEREIEQKQRQMERKIRAAKEKEQNYRTLNKVSPNADLLKKAREQRKKAHDLNLAYEAYSRKNGVPFYRERTRIV